MIMARATAARALRPAARRASAAFLSIAGLLGGFRFARSTAAVALALSFGPRTFVNRDPCGTSWGAAADDETRPTGRFTRHVLYGY